MNVCDLTDVEIPHAAGALYSTPKIFCAKCPIFNGSETLFFFKVVEATLEFQIEASGAALSCEPAGRAGVHKETIKAIDGDAPQA